MTLSRSSGRNIAGPILGLAVGLVFTSATVSALDTLPAVPSVKPAHNHAAAISDVSVTNITATSAIVTWTTSAPTDSRVEFGSTLSYGQMSYDPALVTAHTRTLEGLAPGTTYHFRVQSIGENGVPSIAGGYTFMTPAAPDPALPIPAPAPTPAPTPTPETRAEAKPELKPGPEQPKAETKVEPRTEPRPESKPEPEPRTESKPEPKPAPTPKSTPAPAPAPPSTPTPAPATKQQGEAPASAGAPVPEIPRTIAAPCSARDPYAAYGGVGMCMKGVWMPLWTPTSSTLPRRSGGQ